MKEAKVLQPEAKKLREKAESLPNANYIYLKMAVVEVYSCVSCASWAIDHCKQAREELSNYKP